MYLDGIKEDILIKSTIIDSKSKRKVSVLEKSSKHMISSYLDSSII
jgi:hypothetical protein